MQTPLTTLNADQALQRLIEGNQRYADMRPLHPHQSLTHRQSLLQGQHPFAAVLSCSDSRVPSEIIFDQGLGDLFIVRMAGHVLDDLVLASLEFAVYALHVPLVVVLGHASCGAVAAAVRGQPMPGRLSQLAEVLQPAVEAARDQPGDLLENAIRANSHITAQALAGQSTILAEGVAAGRVKIVPAYYDLAEGRVEILGD
jgi:carbonic anhydrase